MRRLESIQILRGLAALWVVTFHLIGGVGYLGVYAFFVISGFVIPYAMQSLKYEFPRDAGSFLLRRLIRLEPPYIVSVFLAFAIQYLAARAPGYHGAPYNFDVEEFALQFVYLPTWLGKEWINGVAWTLAIEFQYYVLMLFIVPLLLSSSERKRWLFLLLIVALSFISADWRAVFRFLPCFGLGFVAFLRFTDRLARDPFIAILAGFTALACWRLGYPVGLVAVASAGLIFVPIRRPVPLLSFLGTISYSLYLVHWAVGTRVENLSARMFPGAVSILIAFVSSFIAAYLLWRFVERPAMALSKRINRTSR
jgi:peptidoglycan/LPS O-acetylase OafA/YrhL